ncbi:MAG: hypothetical protein DRP08_03595, partial [Candidatus Aenigmatarchaeota archaeon]
MHRIGTLFLAIMIFVSSVQAKYICTTDEAFVQWLNQEPADIEDDTVLIKYSDNESCQTQCRTTESCLYSNTTDGSPNGYTCPLFDVNTDLGGDIDINLFSSASNCNSQCFIQNPCTEWTSDPKCIPTAFDKSHPVSDYTGKTVFTKYSITWDCDTSETIAGECIKYEQQTIQGDIKFDFSKIGWKSKEFAGADEAMTAIAGLDQLGHIWSGWEGECENGTLYDGSWMSDPMTLLSFAMMAYTGALEGGYGDAMKSGAETVSDSFDEVASLGEASTNTYDGQAVTGLNSSGDTYLGGGTTSGGTTSGGGWFQEVKDFYNTTVFNATDYNNAVTYGSLAMDAASIIAAGMSKPAEDDFEMADDFMKSQLGGNAKSIAAVNYSQCMASIGLSFPNMVGYSVDQNESMSSQLREPWKNLISMSDNQLAELMHATSEAYVRASYLLFSHGDGTGVGKYIPISSVAYSQAGQVICGNGNIALAMNALNNEASDESSGMNGAAMANAAIGAVLGYLPAPWNLIASIVFKILTSFSSGDACTDEDIAMKWGIQQFKTNKALQGEQCHKTGSDCAAKWFWGSCMRTVTYYCCYDQQMSRIFVEGVKEQLGKTWEVGECDDISLS